MKEFIYQEKAYPIVIVRKQNKNTYIRIKEEKIVVTTSYLMPTIKITKLIQDNQKAIEKMLERSIRNQEKEHHFYLLGKEYFLEFNPKYTEPKIEENRIGVKDEKTLESFLKEYRSSLFLTHLEKCYSQFDEKIPFPKLKCLKMKTRWGVCNTKTKTITLNSELLRYEVECLDYVIIHELSHLLVPNHSSKFWSVVVKYCPNYKEIRKKLRS